MVRRCFAASMLVVAWMQGACSTAHLQAPPPGTGDGSDASLGSAAAKDASTSPKETTQADGGGVMDAPDASDGGVDASTASDASSEQPFVLLLVDTSGSMERTVGCTCLDTACENCLPDCTMAERNRWAVELEALTGTFEDFACEPLERTAENGATYDLGSAWPLHAITFSSQRQDGLIDRYGARVRFGLATFDGWDTYVGSPPLVPNDEFDRDKSAGQDGMWSYDPGDESGDFFYPNSTTVYTMDTGIRGPDTDDGGLVLWSAAEETDSIHARIERRLMQTRPYGGTPIAAAFDDLYHVFAHDPGLADVPVALRHVVLVTDGYPDDDYRSYGCACFQNDDPDATGYCQGDDPSRMMCPYPLAEDAARYLVEGRPEPSDDVTAVPKREPGPPRVANVHVIGINTDAEVTARLEQIAQAGGTTTRLANDAPSLTAALDAVMAEVLGTSSACAWPADLLPIGSTSRDACHAARALLSCEGPGGATLTCASDDGSACPHPEPGFESVPCENRCEEDEYVATCGGVGPGPIPEPPDGCRDMGANPGGVVYHCCPCL